MALLKQIAVLGTSIGVLFGCGKVIGLDGYEIDESAGDGDTGGDGDGDTGGSPGDGDGDGDTGGTPGDGDGDTGGSSGMECTDGCDDDNECTDDSCVMGECSNVTVMAGEPCTGGVCNGVSGAAECVRCIDDEAGDNQDSGCPEGAPQCDTAGVPICIGCETHDDCADANECTSETCTPEGECEVETEPAGTPCPDGVCNGVANGESCDPCLDDAAGTGQDTGCSSTDPICDETGTGTCGACLDTASGTNQDLGCNSQSPLCIGGACVECSTNGHCNDSVACTVDSCSSGTCVNSPDDSVCDYNEATSKCQACDPISGCEDSGDPVLGSELLFNPAFDSGLVGWVEESSGGWPIITHYNNISTITEHSASYCAWLGGVDDEVSAVYQTEIDVPANAHGVRISGYILRETFETDDDDSASMSLLTDSGSYEVEVRQWNSEDTSWTQFTDEVDISTWDSNSLTLRFDSFVAPHSPPSQENHSSFFFDTLSLRPLVCE